MENKYYYYCYFYETANFFLYISSILKNAIFIIDLEASIKYQLPLWVDTQRIDSTLLPVILKIKSYTHAGGPALGLLMFLDEAYRIDKWGSP